MGKSGEIVATFVNLLHKRCFRVNDPARLQHPVNLSDTPMRIYDMLENGLNDYTVERIILERNVMRVADQRRPGAKQKVGLHQLDRSWGSEQGFHAGPSHSPSDHQDSRADRIDQQQLLQFCVIPLAIEVTAYLRSELSDPVLPCFLSTYVLCAR